MNLTENHLFGCNWPQNHPFELKFGQIVRQGVFQHSAKDFSKILIFRISKAKFVKNGQNGPEKPCSSICLLVPHRDSNQSYLCVFLIIRSIYFQILLRIFRVNNFFMKNFSVENHQIRRFRPSCLPSVRHILFESRKNNEGIKIIL